MGRLIFYKARSVLAPSFNIGAKNVKTWLSWTLRFLLHSSRTFVYLGPLSSKRTNQYQLRSVCDWTEKRWKLNRTTRGKKKCAEKYRSQGTVTATQPSGLAQSRRRRMSPKFSTQQLKQEVFHRLYRSLKMCFLKRSFVPFRKLSTRIVLQILSVGSNDLKFDMCFDFQNACRRTTSSKYEYATALLRHNSELLFRTTEIVKTRPTYPQLSQQSSWQHRNIRKKRERDNRESLEKSHDELQYEVSNTHADELENLRNTSANKNESISRN